MPHENPGRLLLMGRCTRAHGIAGEVKVYPETDDPERLAGLARVFVGLTPAEAEERKVEGARLQIVKGGTTVLLKLEGFETPESVEALRGLGVWAEESDLPPLDEGEVFVHDLIGLTAYAVGEGGAADPEPLGVVADVLEGGAQLLFVVRRDGRPDVLVPDVPAFVVTVDVDAGRLLLDPPEGLFA